jgi:hypothetical protein
MASAGVRRIRQKRMTAKKKNPVVLINRSSLTAMTARRMHGR